MPKNNKSVRLQMRDLKEKHPEEFESHDHVVVLFVEEGRYADTHTKYVVGDISQRAEVTVKCGPGKSYPATIIYIGSESECKRRVDLLTRNVQAAELSGDELSVPKSKPKSKTPAKDDNIEKELQKELLKVKQFEATADEDDDLMPVVKDEDDDKEDDYFGSKNQVKKKDICTGTDAWRQNMSSKMELILNKIKKIESTLQSTHNVRSTLQSTNNVGSTLPSTSNVGSTLQSTSNVGSTLQSTNDAGILSLDKTPPTRKIPIALDTPDRSESPVAASALTLMYQTTNLLMLPSDSGNVKKFAFNVFKTIFKDEEMVNHSIEPNGKALKNGTIGFDKERVELLKKAILLKFGEKVYNKKWQDLRKCLNQKCLDKKRDINKKSGLQPDQDAE